MAVSIHLSESVLLHLCVYVRALSMSVYLSVCTAVSMGSVYRPCVESGSLKPDLEVTHLYCLALEQFPLAVLSNLGRQSTKVKKTFNLTD